MTDTDSAREADDLSIASDLRGPNPWARRAAVISTVVASAIYLGIALFVSDMLTVFRSLTASGSGDAKVMAGGISQALANVIVAGVFGSAGLLLTLLTVWFSLYRTRWFFWVSLLLAMTYLVFIPVAAIAVVFAVIPIMAITLIVLLLSKRREFFQHARTGGVT